MNRIEFTVCCPSTVLAANVLRSCDGHHAVHTMLIRAPAVQGRATEKVGTCTRPARRPRCRDLALGRRPGVGRLVAAVWWRMALGAGALARGSGRGSRFARVPWRRWSGGALPGWPGTGVWCRVALCPGAVTSVVWWRVALGPGALARGSGRGSRLVRPVASGGLVAERLVRGHHVRRSGRGWRLVGVVASGGLPRIALGRSQGTTRSGGGLVLARQAVCSRIWRFRRPRMAVPPRIRRGLIAWERPILA